MSVVADAGVSRYKRNDSGRPHFQMGPFLCVLCPKSDFFKCVLWLTQAFPDMNVMILGDPIFRSMLILHDLEPPVYRVGVAAVDSTYGDNMTTRLYDVIRVWHVCDISVTCMWHGPFCSMCVTWRIRIHPQAPHISWECCGCGFYLRWRHYYSTVWCDANVTCVWHDPFCSMCVTWLIRIHPQAPQYIAQALWLWILRTVTTWLLDCMIWHECEMYVTWPILLHVCDVTHSCSSASPLYFARVLRMWILLAVTTWLLDCMMRHEWDMYVTWPILHVCDVTHWLSSASPPVHRTGVAAVDSIYSDDMTTRLYDVTDGDTNVT